MATMEDAIKELYIMFNVCNENLFDGKISEPVILIQQKGKQDALGWVSVDKIWKDRAKNRKHELTITAEYLMRPVVGIASTMIHEMVHLDNLQKGIKDCSRDNRYHNKKFKKAAEALGFIVEHDSTHGWTRTIPGPELKIWIEDAGFDESAFSIARELIPAKIKVPKDRKKFEYVCDVCDLKIKTNKKQESLMCCEMPVTVIEEYEGDE